jgi:hypothetical protein
MRKPQTVTLLIAGFGLCLASGIFMRGSVALRPLYTPSGEIMRRADGSRMFEHDTLAQFQNNWFPYLMIAVGLFCLVWSAIRGVRFLYDRANKRAA